jgi:hypothetical protein
MTSRQLTLDKEHCGKEVQAYTMSKTTETFPIDLSRLEPLKLDPSGSPLTDAQKSILRHNIQLCRDAIVFFTALAGARGLSGHTGGAFDTVPEVMIIRAFIANGTPIVPIFYDEAGHPGHPEKLLTSGVEFSPGRPGHMWAFVNGVASANPGKSVVLLGSDGSQMEGDNAEAPASPSASS